MILTLNIETVADTSIPKELLPSYDDFKDDYKKQSTIEEKVNEAMSRLGLSPLTGEIICVAIKKDNNPAEIVGGTVGKELITNTMELIAADNRLVTFNGKAFDMWFLMVQAAMYDISIPPNYAYRYLSRYSNDHHVDMYGILSNNQWKKGNLAKWAIRLGAPPIFGDGSKVQEWYNSLDVDSIHKHSLSNVEATYFMYKKFERFL